MFCHWKLRNRDLRLVQATFTFHFEHFGQFRIWNLHNFLYTFSLVAEFTQKVANKHTDNNFWRRTPFNVWL